MMRADLRQITRTALLQQRFVPAISVYDFMTAQGVVAGSEAGQQPVVLLVPPKVAATAGVDSVLVDGSALPDNANAALVRQARSLVNDSIVIEAELGQLQGDEDKAHRRAHSAARKSPLVLHGASGLPRADLRRAARMGIGKVTINTELRSQIFTVLESHTTAFATDGLDLLGLTRTWTKATQSFTTALLADI